MTDTELDPESVSQRIISCLKSHVDGISYKDLKKVVLGSVKSEKSSRMLFKSCLDDLIGNNTVDNDDILRILRLNKKDLKRKRKTQDADENKSEKAIFLNDKVATTVSTSKELWKNGEQVYRDGSLDAEYLRNNPESITRLFCGNLNRKITEEQLKTAIPGIKYIKWMVDKGKYTFSSVPAISAFLFCELGTKEFYGTTFLEMRDEKFAAKAVSMDKSKLMGR